MSAYEIFADWYDVLTGDVDYDAQGRFVCDLFSQYGVREGIVLDLACGTGSLSLRLAAAGYDVIGVDASAQMLSCAQQKAQQADAKILFLCQQMQSLDLYGTVRACACMLDSLNHLTSLCDLRETIRRVSLFLEPGGVFVFDVNTPYKHRHILADNAFVRQTDDLYLIWQNELLPQDTVRITLDFFEAAEQEDVFFHSVEQFSERAYPLAYLKKILAADGLNVQAVYDGWSFQSPKRDSQRWTVVAQKMGDEQIG